MIEKYLNIGIDVGKRHDPTAFCAAVCEQREDDSGELVTYYNIPNIKRLPLGMDYPSQAKEIIRLCHSAKSKFAKHIIGPYFDHMDPEERNYELSNIYPYVRVDLTGVGDALVDMLKAPLEKNGGFSVLPCRFTHGGRITPGMGSYNVGKEAFAALLQVLSENKRIHLPKDPESLQLAIEMPDYDIDIDESGSATFGAMRPGTHDDMVTALGLACLFDPFN